MADLFIDSNEFLAQLNEGAIPLHLLLHLFQFRPQGEIAGLCLSANAGIPQILWAVAGMVLVSTGAIKLAALTKIYRNSAAAEISKILQLEVKRFSVGFEVGDGLFQCAAYLNVHTHSDYRQMKRDPQL